MSETAVSDTESPGRAHNVAVVGGGSGLAVLLRGLKDEVGGRIANLTAVVTVADDGGSSGRLRQAFGVLPPGDIRNCLVALADDEDLLARLFQYRFPGGDGLTGHSFGNLFLTALTGITGDFHQAVMTAETILSVRGHIVPATLTDVRLRAAGLSGRVYEGESAVGQSRERLSRLEMQPPDAAAFPPAVRALRDADLILLGPGSLYTSILPNLLIAGVREAIRASRAPKVLVLNLMTQPGETERMDGLDHLRALRAHVGPGLIDEILINATPLPAERLATYADAGAQPVAVDHDAIAARGVRITAADLLADGAFVRHDPAKLCEAALALADQHAGDDHPLSPDSGESHP